MNINSTFVGRAEELDLLDKLHQSNKASLVAIKGRRRIGKSRLVYHFASTKSQNRLWSFAGLAPSEGITKEEQLNHFGRQLASSLCMPPFTFEDWSDALAHLSRYLKPGDIILLDEISWLAAGDPTFVSKLKSWWDQETQKRAQGIMLIICGSVSTWIEENIIKSTAFFGRINLSINLNPLSIPEAIELLRISGFKGSEYDQYKILGILGGIPWYLEQVSSGETADEIVKRLCLSPNGLLVGEFTRIFHDLFDNKGPTYQRILHTLKDGMQTLADVRRELDFPHSGTLSEMMENLITAGFVAKQQLWSFKTSKSRKQSLYRICDPYMRFYLKIIEPNHSRINLGAFKDISLNSLQGFPAHLGIQIEYLLLQNRSLLIKSLGIKAQDIINDGPYRQNKTTTRPGCQIDYLIQTRSNTIYLCEFKFRNRELSSTIMQEVQDKISALKVPRGFAVVPVLFHIGGVSENLEMADYFYSIVDIATL